jgi:hypothetical protein
MGLLATKGDCAMRDYILNQAISLEDVGGPWIIRLWRNWLARRSVARLETLDDHILQDIGVNRGDLDWAAHLPLNVNATRALEDSARNRLRQPAIG